MSKRVNHNFTKAVLRKESISLLHPFLSMSGSSNGKLCTDIVLLDYKFVTGFLAWCCHNSWVLSLFSRNLIKQYFKMDLILDSSSVEDSVQTVVQIQGVSNENTIGLELSASSSSELSSVKTQDTYIHANAQLTDHQLTMPNLHEASIIVVRIKSVTVPMHIQVHPAKFPQRKCRTQS